MVCRLQTEDNSSNHHHPLASFPDPAHLQATKSCLAQPHHLYQLLDLLAQPLSHGVYSHNVVWLT